MSNGLKAIADDIGSRIRFFKTEEKIPRQGVMLENVTIVDVGPAVAYGKDMRAATKALANMLRGQVVDVKDGISKVLPVDIDPRQYK